MTRAVIVVGPQGCGKTRNAKRLAEYYGKTEILDEFDPDDKNIPRPLPPTALVLTQQLWAGAENYKIVSFRKAATFIRMETPDD